MLISGQPRQGLLASHRRPGLLLSRSGRNFPRGRTHTFSRRLRASSDKGFHQSRLSVTDSPDQSKPKQRLTLSVREAEEDNELAASAYLRAVSFYAYPPERAFAGKIHQEQMRDEEFSALRRLRMNRNLGIEENVRSATLMAVCPLTELPDAEEQLQIHSPNGESIVLLGSLDLVAVRALPGEVLIANTENAAYLANVCVADVARRQGVGSALLETARSIARKWGADGLFVHMMAVNEIARRFYERQGFQVDKEESSNEAHYRGRCLDGIEGRGRTLLLRDSRL